MSTSSPDPNAPQPEQPVDQGATAQEQAQGQSTTQTGPPPEAPGVTPEQGDPAQPATSTTEPTEWQQNLQQQAAVQSPGEPQVVPEQRPQAFTQGDNVSEASKRLDVAPMPDEKGYETANSDEAKQAAIENSRTPNLLVGQRLQIIGDHSEAGRMAYVLQIDYSDGIQGMLAASGTPEARFAEVEDYIVRTRDGRTDILVVTPDQVKPLDDIQGWGRGQI